MSPLYHLVWLLGYSWTRTDMEGNMARGVASPRCVRIIIHD